MIYYVVPYSLEKNIGKAYNQYMRLLKKDSDWLCIMDGDIMFLNFDWGHIIQEIVDSRPDAGMISCYTNRISKNKAQLYGEDSKNILVHRLIAKEMDEKYRGTVKKIRSKVSGFLMVIQKKTWRDMKGFPEIPGKILDIDGLISRRVTSLGKPIYLMRGLYVLHYYRMAEGRKFKDHLRDAELYLKNRPKKERRTRQPRHTRRNSRIIKNRRTHGRSLKKISQNGDTVYNDNLQRDRLPAVQSRVVQEAGNESVRD